MTRRQRILLAILIPAYFVWLGIVYVIAAYRSMFDEW